MQKISITLFNQLIAEMFQEGDRVYLKQIEDRCHKASPLMINENQKEIETTPLLHLERVAGFISDSLPGNFGNEILTKFFLENSHTSPSVSDKLLFIGKRSWSAYL